MTGGKHAWTQDLAYIQFMYVRTCSTKVLEGPRGESYSVLDWLKAPPATREYLAQSPHEGDE